MSRTITLKKPKGSSNSWDLRDVVPIIVNSNLTQQQVYKIAESGVDIREKCTEIIELSRTMNVAAIIEALKPKDNKSNAKI